MEVCMRKITLWLVVVTLLVSLFPSVGMAEDSVMFTGTVTGTTKLHMRSSPSTDASIIRSYNSGAKVEILENDGVWCYVRSGDNTGYMMSKYLDIKSSFNHICWAKTENDGVIHTIYQSADTGSEPAARFWGGAYLDVLEKGTAFCKVRLNDCIGFIPAGELTFISGDYVSAVFNPEMSQCTAAFDRMDFYTKQYGEEMTVSGTANGNSYRFTYPVTMNGKADAMVSKWLKMLKNGTPSDAGGNIYVNYEAWQADDRYVGIRLTAKYEDSCGSAETVLGFIIDLEKDDILYAENAVSNMTRVILVLESRVSALLGSPAEGYELVPDVTWLRNAVITEDGIMVNLPQGIYMPYGMGTQGILLTYDELMNCLSLEGELAKVFTIDPSGLMVAFTFDDGPSEQSSRIMDAFLKVGGHCTFCVQGQRVANYESTVKRIVAEGHEIACHTYNHKKLTNLSQSQIRYQITETQKEVSKIVDYQIKWLRSPYGSTNKTVRSICKEYGMCIAYWYVDTLDWSTKNAKKTCNTILKEIKNGAIILCHDLYEQTADAIEIILPQLQEMGYQFVTLSEMFSFMDGGPEPGTVYFDLKDEDNLGLR